MDQILKGKVAIVTGSGQGIGKGIALYLADQGAKVITNNRAPLDKSKIKNTDHLSKLDFTRMLALKGDAKSVAKEIIERGGEATYFFGDVSNQKMANALIEKAIYTYGRIDILVNNATLLGQGTIENTSEEEWDRMITSKMKGGPITQCILRCLI